VAEGHAEKGIFGSMQLTQADVESDDGGDKSKSTSSISQAM
jgi:hypothetical protein